LFHDRAKAANDSFALTASNVTAVCDICRRLDGIPLAIEFAAARVGLMDVHAISARLDDRFALLTQGRRTALPRQQTLRATLDWSYELLQPQEQQVLRRLSVM
ncbi:transcriptional regulator, partial [Klebsiella pneumoniae]|nr:transcriptional regulator [Klebsiella pneumoniae]